MDREYDDGWVSAHFREHELACPCCGKYIHNLRLIYALEKLRRLCGNRPITVTSGTRCPAWNKAVGGSRKSKHLKGEAADIVVREMHPLEIMVLIPEVAQFDHGGVGVFDHFMHLDVRPNGPARWGDLWNG